MVKIDFSYRYAVYLILKSLKIGKVYVCEVFTFISIIIVTLWTLSNLQSVPNSQIQALKTLKNPNLQGASPPGLLPGGSEHPLDPSFNARSLRERAIQ